MQWDGSRINWRGIVLYGAIILIIVGIVSAGIWIIATGVLSPAEAYYSHDNAMLATAIYKVDLDIQAVGTEIAKQRAGR